MKRTFEWVPAPDDGVYQDGTRWAMYETGTVSPGYPAYRGRVCLWPCGNYKTEVGMYPDIHSAAKAVLEAELNMNRSVLELVQTE